MTLPTDQSQTASPAPIDMGALGQRVRSAVFWRSGSQIAGQLISWTVTLIVMALLDPADYGLFAMAAVMMTFLDFLNGYGFASALIQAKDVTPRVIRQTLGLMILLNCGIAALQYSLAPAVALYYGKPEVADLLHVMAFVYLATPFIIVPEVLLARGLDFRRQAIANLIAALVGAGVSLGCAMAGLGVWTLIYAPIAMFYARAVLLTIAARMYLLPSFNFRGLGHVMRFGGALMASHLFWVIQTQTDVTLAGRLMDERDVGLYATALFLSQLVMSKFVPPLNQVAFPTYAQLQDDPVALRGAFLDSVRMIMLVTAPIFLGLAAVAPAMITALFEPRWHAMIPLVQIIACAMPMMTLQILFAPVNNARGAPQRSMRVSMTGAALFAGAFAVGVQSGTHGLAIAWLAASPLLLLATILISRPSTNAGPAMMLSAAAPAILCAAAMAALVIVVDHLLPPGVHPLLRLALLVSSGIAAYAGVSRMGQWSQVLRLIAMARGTTTPPSAANQAPAI